MRDYRFVGPISPGPPRQIKNEIPPAKGNRQVVDPVAQKQFGTTQPGELGQFPGLTDDDVQDVIGTRYVPPDVNGDIGLTQYVEYINTIWAVYDRTGGLLLGPLPGNSFWQGLGGVCESHDDGDPIVMYDQLADRWLASQFVLPAPSHQCIAISQTGDATGAWFQYDFLIDSVGDSDYPKFGIWPDGYYMTSNVFSSPNYGGAFSFDRTKMLVGDPTATMIAFQTTYNALAEFGVLPSDFNGVITPPAGAPNYFVAWDTQLTPECNGACLLIWQFHSDFASPGSSTFTGPAVLPVPAFNYPVCGSFRDQCVPQQSSSELLETLSGVQMYPLPYRNFGDHEAILACQTVGDGTGIAQVRWYEIRDPGNSPVLYQAATYAPDSTHRWMPSIAFDQNGNIALNYSRSDSTLFPQCAITGRLATDPLDTLGAEAIWFAGTGSQENSFSRWGDYTSIFVDPLDDCTFWAINEYYETTTDFDWKTRVGSFKYPSCTSGPTGLLEGTVTDGTNPIQGATVTAGLSGTLTNIAGHYQFTLPVGTYDMTASKFGYSPDSASGVVVTDGGDTIQDFVLTPGASVVVNGVVKDGSGEGWPLYAKIVITTPGFPGATLYTDPVTGYYSYTLVEGSYNFAITAVSPGYLPGGGPVVVSSTAPSDPGGQVVNWDLLVASPACIAPGYSSPAGVVYETFDADGPPPGWSLVTNVGNPWIFVTSDPCGIFTGNRTGGTGRFAVADGLCDYLNFNVFDDNELITPSVDMSAATSPIIRWNNDFVQYAPYYHQVADVDISTNGGASWTNVWERTVDERGPGVQTVDITALAAGQPSVQARFHYTADPADFWAWWWQVDNVLLGQSDAPCQFSSGGLVVGNVRDGNNGAGLNGATVTNLPADGTTTTFATPEDPNQDDGFYILFAGSGPQPFEASMDKYTSQNKNAVVIPNSTVRLDFSLAAGLLSADPTTLTEKVLPGDTAQQILTISNSGSGDGSFEVIEINAALSNKPIQKGPFASFEQRKKALERIAKAKGSFLALTGKDFPQIPNAPPPSEPNLPWAAGDVLASYPTQIPYGWGVGFDTTADDFWLSNIGLYGGGNLDYRYLPDGTLTPDTINLPWVSVFAADSTYNSNTGMLWQVNVGGDNCIYEVDPIAKVSTGNSICPAFGTSERGLAYDPLTDTYYAGSWNDFTIKHFDADGTILDSASVGLGISGLAFFPDSGHLYVQVSDPVDFSISVLDVNDNYNVVGNFQVSDGAFDDHGGAGMEVDCDGNLWMVNQFTQTIYKVASGETGSCGSDIPWLSENPTTGTLAPGGSSPVTVTFDSAGLFPGLRQAQLKIKTDTPYPVSPVGINFTVRFLDVPLDEPPGTYTFENFIYAAAGANIMHGCSFFNFCPSAEVTRADMAGYIWRSVHGAFFSPPVYTGIFSDVFFGDYNADYIQGVWNDGITAGCQAPGDPLQYCPDQSIPRGQMAVFIEKGVRGSSFVPPPCTGIFTDVSCPPTPSDPYGDWVELLFNDGITSGCNAPDDPPAFCPLQLIPNEQMAVFIVKAFGFPVLP